ncbi:MAG: DUF3791 domain-containing protein [Treponema sp.]|nr:DUF3791 domain-containing protein [Treponema sp.]
MRKNVHAETDRALWLLHCISFAAEELSLNVSDTARLLNDYGLIKPILDGYDAFHTQGYEYMSEMLIDELRKAQGT